MIRWKLCSGYRYRAWKWIIKTNTKYRMVITSVTTIVVTRTNAKTRVLNIKRKKKSVSENNCLRSVKFHRMWKLCVLYNLHNLYWIKFCTLPLCKLKIYNIETQCTLFVKCLPYQIWTHYILRFFFSWRLCTLTRLFNTHFANKLKR